MGINVYLLVATLGARQSATPRSTSGNLNVPALSVSAASLLLALIALIVAARMGNDLVHRLRRLRDDTIEADARLPQIVERIRRGEHIDASEEVATFNYGFDEVGELAAALNKAQGTAVDAAGQEAQLREGAKAAFLNIARRSQTLVERQLKVLDRAQRTTEDPDQITLLFQLDHLSTRERRNAENIIILAGGKLARQWRTPVRLINLVRGAVAETEQYNRVTLVRIPDVSIAGHAVADLVHLLAELIDNAMDFSPSNCRVEVHSDPVGHGVVVEIDDRGIGIPADYREEYNAMLRNPPDFDFMALEDARVGFFVVARLARSHGIRVSLLESPYGGLRAVVLIPQSLITSYDEPEDEFVPIGNWFTTGEPAPQSPSPADRPTAISFSAHQQALVASTPTVIAPSPTEKTRSHEIRSPSTAAEVEVHGDNNGPQWPETEPADDDGRPPLPKRRRQEHLAAQLRNESSGAEPDHSFADDDLESGAVEAQRRMAAFQRGTLRGRVDEESSEFHS